MTTEQLSPRRYAASQSIEVKVYGPMPEADPEAVRELGEYDGILPNEMTYTGELDEGDYVVVFPDRAALAVPESLFRRLFIEIPEGSNSRQMWCTSCAANREFDLREDVLMSKHPYHYRCRVCGYELPAALPAAGLPG